MGANRDPAVTAVLPTLQKVRAPVRNAGLVRVDAITKWGLVSRYRAGVEKCHAFRLSPDASRSTEFTGGQSHDASTQPQPSHFTHRAHPPLYARLLPVIRIYPSQERRSLPFRLIGTATDTLAWTAGLRNRDRQYASGIVPGRDKPYFLCIRPRHGYRNKTNSTCIKRPNIRSTPNRLLPPTRRSRYISSSPSP